MAQSDDSKHGKHSYVLFTKESVYGTAVSATRDFGLIQNFAPSGNRNLVSVHSAGTVDSQSVMEGQAELTGSIEFIFQHGRILELITGGSVTHAETTSDWKHTFALDDALPSVTIEEGFNSTNDIENIWKGVKFSQVTISYTKDAPIMIKADWNARDVNASGTTASSKVISTLKPFPAFMGDLKWGTTGSETSYAVVDAFDFVINAAGAGDMTLRGANSVIPEASEPNQRTFTFNAVVGFKDNTELQHFLGATTGALDNGTEIASKGLVFEATNGTALGSGKRNILIDLSGCKINSYSRPTPLNGYIYTTIEGQALTIDELSSIDSISSGSW